MKKIYIALVLIIGLSSFRFIADKLMEFSYPKRKHTTLTIDAPQFKKFSKEWRGKDYYYFGTSKDGMICSILYYKLNEAEQKLMVESAGTEIKAGIPYLYFTQNSKLKEYERNSKSWGNVEDTFMFRQFDIPELQGMQIDQKHMYAYGMLDKDLFVNIHISKVGATSADSIAMREILSSLKMK